MGILKMGARGWAIPISVPSPPQPPSCCSQGWLLLERGGLGFQWDVSQQGQGKPPTEPWADCLDQPTTAGSSLGQLLECAMWCGGGGLLLRMAGAEQGWWCRRNCEASFSGGEGAVSQSDASEHAAPRETPQPLCDSISTNEG